MAFQSEYRGSTTNFGFGSFKQNAASEVGRAKQRTEEIVRDEQTKQKGLKNYTAYQSAKMKGEYAQGQAHFAKQRANLATISSIIKGVGGLSSTIGKIQQQQAAAARQAEIDAERAANEAWENQMLFDLEQEVGISTPTGVEADEQMQYDRDVLNANMAGTAAGHSILQESGEEGLAQQLNEESLYNDPVERGIRHSISTAPGAHQDFLAEKIEQNKSALAGMSNADARAQIREWNREFIKGVNIPGGSGSARKRALLGLYKGLQNNTNNALRNLGTSRRAFQQDMNKANEAGDIAAAASAGSVSQAWQIASDAAASNGVNGFIGRNAITQERALKGLLNQYMSMEGGLAKIQELRMQQSVPGQRGTEFYKMPKYAQIFDEAIRKAETFNRQIFNHNRANEKFQIQQIAQQYHNDPSQENRVKTVEALMQIGSTAAIAEANRIAPNGNINYDPAIKFEIGRRAAQGDPYTPEELQTFLQNGVIDEATYKQHAQADPQQAALKEAYGTSRVADFKEAIAGNVINSDGSPGTAISDDKKGAIRVQLAQRARMFESELKAELAKLPAETLQDPGKFAAALEKTTMRLLQQDRYRLVRSDDGIARFGAPMAAGQESVIRIAPGVEDYSALGAGRLKDLPRGAMDPGEDRFMSSAALRQAVELVRDGKDVTSRTKDIANMLGMSVNQLLDSQLKVNGMPSLETFTQPAEAPGAAPTAPTLPMPTDSQGAPAPTGAEGATSWSRQETYGEAMAVGFPEKGAAYLAGNIMTESGGTGNRTPWDDVGAPAGGIASWRAGRLDAIQRHFGKPITQISNREQMQYLKNEMRTKYPSAFRTFMNPNSTDGDLKAASFKFWGWGEQGDRFQHASQIIAENAGKRRTMQQTSFQAPTTSAVLKGMESVYGMDSSAGPDGGRNACVWMVNKALAAAGVPIPWGNSNYVPHVKGVLDKKGVKLSGPQPGAIAIMTDNHPTAPYPHIGLVDKSGQILSNSSGRAKFDWRGSPASYERYYGGRVIYYALK